jgi:LEA14-like dessication related protein
MKSLKLFFAALLIFYVLVGCSKPVSPKYLGYQNFRMEKIGFTSNVLATEVKLYNPNRYPLHLKSATLDFYLNNSFLGHSTLDSLIVLPARDTSYIPLRLQASAKDILSNTAKILLNPNVKIKITGSAKAGRGGFFVNVPIDYEGTQRIELLGSN